MKKALFAMLAVALLGGQAFGATDVKLSDYEGEESFTSDILTTDSNIIVDTSEKSGGGKFEGGNHTIFFDGDNVWQANTTAYFNLVKVDINATQSAVQNWIDALTSESDSYRITLFKNASFVSGPNRQNVPSLMGVDQGGSITLTGTEDTLTAEYAGIVAGDFALLNNQVGLVVTLGQSFTYNYILVGKGLKSTPIVPEPATATLSLLALAGLATRRRRK